MVAGSLYSITDEFQLREALLAASRISSHGEFLSPISFVDLVQRSVAVSQSADNFPAWALLAVSRTNQDKTAPSPWIQKWIAEYRDAISHYYQPGSASSPGSGGSVAIAGASFRAIPAGDLVMGKDDNLDTLGKSIDRLLAHPVRIESFYLGSTEVTNASFQQFVAESPDWSPSNKTDLIQKGLVTDTYLQDWKSGAPPAGAANLPVSSISWHAAAAYCQWLTHRVQASLPGFVARLPSEAEWEWAARGGIARDALPARRETGRSGVLQAGNHRAVSGRHIRAQRLRSS